MNLWLVLILLLIVLFVYKLYMYLENLEQISYDNMFHVRDNRQFRGEKE